jgi:hypothetical protein
MDWRVEALERLCLSASGAAQFRPYRKDEAMAQPTKEQIRTRAHQLWEQAGKPEGREDDFRHEAEQQLLNEDKSSPLRTPDNL